MTDEPLFEYAELHPVTPSSPRFDITTGTIAVVDLETTGRYTPPHRVCEIAIVRWANGRVIDEWSSVINPHRDAGPIHIHQLTNHDLLAAPAFSEIVGDVIDRLRDATIVAHSAVFEEHFLAAEFAQSGITLPLLPAFCTREAARVLVPDSPDLTLSGLCKYFSIPLIHVHTALGDARATASLAALLMSRSTERHLQISTLHRPPTLPQVSSTAAPHPRPLPGNDLAR